jgi:hypothetical protein
MLGAFLLAAVSAAGCIPIRWEPGVLPLSVLEGTPVNCLVVEKPGWQPDKGGLRVFAPEALERQRLSLDKTGEVLATAQALWPGIKVQKGGAVVAAPTGAPWIETNGGFVRFLRGAAGPGPEIWLMNPPPRDAVLSPQKYIQAIADAAMNGAHWVIDLDPGFRSALASGDAKAQAGWQRIARVLRFYAEHHAECDLPEAGALAVVEDAAAGGLLSGGFLDMIGARNIPVRALPPGRLAEARSGDYSLLLNIDPSALSDEQKTRLRELARGGATLLNAPPGWRLESAPDGMTFDPAQVKRVDEAWREINSLIGRRNFGVRLFGAPGVLTSFRRGEGGRMALHLVNYTDYPVEAITVHALGRYGKATLLTPSGPRAVECYETEDGTGVDIPKLEDVAILVLESQEKR